ncbi:hypothetical protein SPMU_32010 [Sphingomonas mucosissima]|uniref:Phage integrase family protein n=1 Tax=Sphingomonas mucosissima TaxID=370959 RepID=A0A245ZDW7_9SPHN|nr:hypothetical protein SPMU_32010 [Sphingomonas mucosissima]
MGHSSMDPAFHELPPWNEGRLIGAKRALKQQQVWAIRFWLDQQRRLRDRALFDFAIDSKLRGCDVVKTRVGDVVSGGRIRDRAIIVQQKTRRPVQFELMDTARKTMRAAGASRRYTERLRLPKPQRLHGSYQYAAICPSRTRVGHRHWPAASGVRNALASAHQGLNHLQGDRQPPRSSDPSRPRQDRQHCALLGR